MRTAYDGEQFEFMCKYMTPKTIKPIRELNLNNYAIYMLSDLSTQFDLFKNMEDLDRLNKTWNRIQLFRRW